MRDPANIRSIAVIGVLLAAAPALAQTRSAPADDAQAASEPTQSSLTVGALHIGSAAALAIDGIHISVAPDSITYSYVFKNTGPTELSLMASIAMPELQASSDGSETWVLASNDPENPVGLKVTAAGAPIATKAVVRADALDLDRLAEIKAEHLPLIPFGPETDKALAALSPEAADRLAALGVISSRDPAQPKAPLTADWSLASVLSWRLVLPAGKATPLVIKFTPVKGRYRMAKGDEDDLDDMKDDLCLKPQVLNTLQSRLKSGSAWDVTDMTLSVDGPSGWIDSPAPTLAVTKPRAEAIVAFCGKDEKTAGRPTILGTAPEEDEIRIVIFEPAAQ